MSKGYDGLIFLPGMMCNAQLFSPQVEAFQGAVAIEIGDLSSAQSIESMAQQVLQTTAFETFALAGLSLGGIVAMEVVRQAPHRVERLALLDTNHLPDQPDRIQQRQRQIERVTNGELVQVMRDELKPFYVAPQHMDDPRLNSIFLDMATSLGPNVFERQARALIARHGSEDILSAYEGETLVLCGEHDLPCPPSRHEAMHEILANSELVIVQDAGHVTTLENPMAVNSALRKWLDQ